MDLRNVSKNKISRKKFLKILSSIVAGGSILGVSGVLLRKRLADAPSYGSDNQAAINSGRNAARSLKDNFTSPYKLVSSFSTPGNIEAIELAGENLIAATPNNISVYDRRGSLLNNFVVGSNLRDMASDNERLFLLFPTRVEVYSHEGEWLYEWEACSDLSDYCSMAVTPDAVFVTDASNKNICKYAKDGSLVKIIQSPNGFIIPSYSFGITYADGVIYSSNSGRHRVEKYSVDGKYIGSFGKTGGATGMFCGCCNPVHLTHTPTGEIITSEKGNPRISCYGSDGEFRSMLLDSKALGGGNTAYDVKVSGDKLFVAGKNIISVFQYDKVIAAKTSCSDCGVECPLRG